MLRVTGSRIDDRPAPFANQRATTIRGPFLTHSSRFNQKEALRNDAPFCSKMRV
jgi:hypothetical protein